MQKFNMSFDVVDDGLSLMASLFIFDLIETISLCLAFVTDALKIYIILTMFLCLLVLVDFNSFSSSDCRAAL